MTHYRLDICYRGDAHWGYQSQPDGRGVQDAIEHALATVLREPVRLRGGSRTDTGVHAELQIAVLTTEVPFDSHKLCRSLNALLAPHIQILRVSETDAKFHPIRSAKQKIYRYQLWQGTYKSPFLEPYVWSLPRPLDLQKLSHASSVFIGRHDFSSFCNQGTSAKTRVRTVYEIQVVDKDPLIEIWIAGSGFLKQMVRIMIGTLVGHCQGRMGGRTIEEVLAAKDRSKAYKTAPPEGLFLVGAVYQEGVSLNQVIANYNVLGVSSLF